MPNEYGDEPMLPNDLMAASRVASPPQSTMISVTWSLLFLPLRALDFVLDAWRVQDSGCPSVQTFGQHSGHLVLVPPPRMFGGSWLGPVANSQVTPVVEFLRWFGRGSATQSWLLWTTTGFFVSAMYSVPSRFFVGTR